MGIGPDSGQPESVIFRLTKALFRPKYSLQSAVCKCHTVKSHVKALGLNNFIRGFGWAYKWGWGGGGVGGGVEGLYPGEGILY